MSKNNSSIVLEARQVRRVFEETGEKLEVLKGVDFSLHDGEIVVLTGVSGSGKSTFLNIMGTLDRPTSGQVLYRGEDLSSFNDKRLDQYRRENIGFVFQFHHLLPELNALENVMLPAQLANNSEARTQAEELLVSVGLKERMNHLPRELSGGERQRAAIARALVNRPAVVMADEPSGNLDEANSRKLHELFFSLNAQYQQTFLIVTHDEHLAENAGRRVHMSNGIIP
jgi:lipoprotein-releasing system ATP-binding protein